MTSNTRRVFMLQVASAGTALAASPAWAQGKKLEENEPQAMALGYKDDTRTVDAKKFPKHSSSQTCTNCTIWRGKGADGGHCHLFGNRVLSGNGWCSQWVAKG
jgi:High potential iron-sulfur protein